MAMSQNPAPLGPLQWLGFMDGDSSKNRNLIGFDPSPKSINTSSNYKLYIPIIKGNLGGETSVLRTFRMSGKELVKERVSEGKS